MDIMALIAAFGGGLLGATIGGLPSFILTGIFAIAGTGIIMAGGADVMVGFVAFGSILGPHVAFTGGVAAAAYACRKGKLDNGGAIGVSLNGLGAPDVLVVGGIFGMIGFMLNWVIASFTPLGAGGVIANDTVATTVFIMGIVIRVMFGQTGVTGKYTESGAREWVSSGSACMQNIVLGLGYGVMVSFVLASMSSALAPEQYAVVAANFPAMCFGLAATSLVFTQTGSATPGVHHIVLPAAMAAATGIAAWGPYGAVLGVVWGIAGSLLGDFAGKTFNSYCDSHIDPPAFAILLLTALNTVVAAAVIPA